MAERRYDDDEVRDIFDRASRLDDEGLRHGSSGAVSRGDTGMSLAELQQIGSEAGIDPALVARAAAQLEVGAASELPVIRQFGVPVSVGRVVDLPRRLTESEWDRLVVRLRDLFHARGKVVREGSLRSWANGNLQILMEPTAAGYRLRMRSLSQNGRGKLVGGGALAAAGTVLGAFGGVVGTVGSIDVAGLVLSVGVVGAAALALVGSGIAGLRRWIPLRDSQFRQIGEFAVEMASTDATKELP